MKLGNIFKVVSNAADKHKGTVLTIISIGSTLYAVYRAAKDGPKYREILDQANEEGAGSTEKLKRLAKEAAPVVTATGISILSQVGMHKVAADAINVSTTFQTLYNGVAAAKDEFVAETEKVAGKETTEKIKKAVAAKDYARSDDYIIATGHGNDVFVDSWSGRKFYSDINFIKKAVNDLNYQLMNDMFISVNEYYGYLDLPACDSGRNCGWNIDKGTLEIDITASLDENDKPYTVISFRNTPQSINNGRYW